MTPGSTLDVRARSRVPWRRGHILVADEPISITTYAEILAHIVARRDQPLDVVLGAHGVTMEQLRAADAHWNDQLRISLRRRKGMLAMTFASAFADARHARGLFGPPAEDLPPPRSAATPPEAAALPSYLAPTAAPAPTPVAPPPPSSTPPSWTRSAAPGTVMTPAVSSQRPLVPFEPAEPGAARDAPERPAAAPAARGPGTGTLPTSPDAPRQPETPWDQASKRIGKLTIAHFAALTIELSRNPPDLTPILSRYGLQSADDIRHVSAAFHAQMQFDPNVRAQFDSLVARMRSMSSQRDGG